MLALKIAPNFLVSTFSKVASAAKKPVAVVDNFMCKHALKVHVAWNVLGSVLMGGSGFKNNNPVLATTGLVSAGNNVVAVCFDEDKEIFGTTVGKIYMGASLLLGFGYAASGAGVFDPEGRVIIGEVAAGGLISLGSAFSLMERSKLAMTSYLVSSLAFLSSAFQNGEVDALKILGSGSYMLGDCSVLYINRAADAETIPSRPSTFLKPQEGFYESMGLVNPALAF